MLSFIDTPEEKQHSSTWIYGCYCAKSENTGNWMVWDKMEPMNASPYPETERFFPADQGDRAQAYWLSLVQRWTSRDRRAA